MKKISTSLLCGSILCAVCAFGACSAPAEERFKTATQSFDNYTAQVNVLVTVSSDGETINYNYDTLLEVDGTRAKIDATYGSITQRVYLKEQDDSVFAYTDGIDGWMKEPYRTIEATAAEMNYCYLEVFQSFYYDDVEEKGGYYYLRESLLSSYSEMVDFTITSVKLKLGGSKFTSAEVVGFGRNGGKFHVDYTFSKYGSTSVTLPT